MSSSTVMQMSLDGSRFHGRWIEDFAHTLSATQFNAELRRINMAWSRRSGSAGSRAAVSYALPFICIPFGILLIVLAMQKVEWPFMVSGLVLAASGIIGSVMFSSILGVVLAICGICLGVLPYANTVGWICIALGSILCTMGCIGLMALALQNNRQWRSARIMVVMLPIGIAFICVPVRSLDWVIVMDIAGFVLCVTGILGAIDAFTRKDRTMVKSIRDLQIIVNQLNVRYSNQLIWTLIEIDQNDEVYTKKQPVQILVELDPSNPVPEIEIVADSTPEPVQAPEPAAPAVVNVTINQAPAPTTNDSPV